MRCAVVGTIVSILIIIFMLSSFVVNDTISVIDCNDRVPHYHIVNLIPCITAWRNTKGSL